MLRYIRKNILALQPYSTARDEFKGGDISVWLDANESPYGNGVNRYPDPHQKRLKSRISEIFHIPAESVFVGGAGSDEAIDLTFRIFCEPGVENVVAITPSYGVNRSPMLLKAAGSSPLGWFLNMRKWVYDVRFGLRIKYYTED